ncbi:MAG: DUF2786 domain-containing protein [Deltaproteobacteria bacterium]|nr:DUF2786 domain-containing protein [Deltaproteobacteria bacterium]
MPLQELWIRQLQLEYDDICFQYRVDLIPPVFEITRSTTRLGAWRAEHRILQLSRYLIEKHPWQVTLQVLKHEMAHQVCTEVFHHRSGGHGPDFHKACELLGVTAPFRRSGSDLAGQIEQTDPGRCRTAAGRRIIDRITKLLALAGSDNEHEAALAMQRAGELLARHNLEQVRLAERSGYTHLVIDTGKKRLAGHIRVICAILRDYFYVQVVCSTLYDPRTNETSRTIELLGREENVPVAEHCYHFLEDRLAFLWSQNRSRHQGHARTARNSYYLGLLRGFAEKLSRQSGRQDSREQTGPQPTPGALILARDRHLQSFISQRFPRLRKVSGRGARIYRDTYNEAVATGRTIILHRAVTEQAADRGGLLE